MGRRALPGGYGLPEVRKAALALLGFVAVVASAALAIGDVIPEGYVKYAALAISLATTYGVFRVPNATARGPFVRPLTDPSA